MDEKRSEEIRKAIQLGEAEDTESLGKLIVKEREVSIDGKMSVGFIKYVELTKVDFDNFEDTETLCELFDVMDTELIAIRDVITKSDKRFVYLQKIDLGFSRGMGIGQVALDLFEKSFKDVEVILYAYPIPSRMANGFDQKYMKQCEKKLIKFYEGCGYKRIAGKVYTKAV